MTAVLSSGLRFISSRHFRATNYCTSAFLPIFTKTQKMSTTTTIPHSDEEPAAKRTKIMPSETKVEATNGHTNAKDRVLMFHKLSEHATAPSRGSEHAVGFDLYSAHDYVIPSQGKEIVATDIQIMLPEGCYGRVAPRSGLAAKSHIDVGAGVIDRDYRGPVGVVLFNHAQAEFNVKRGDRVAQLICEKAYIPELQESAEDLPGTKRGAGGFGSTGGHKSVEKGATEKNGNEKKNEVGESGDAKQN